MAAENIGSIYNTKIPGLDDAADIQEALRLYHYGSLEYDVNNTDLSQLPNPSVARHLKNLQDQADELDQKRTAGDYLADAPTGIADGYIWVDSDSLGPASTSVRATAVYSPTAPTENLADGVIWIDSDSLLKKAYAWDAAILDWVEISQYGFDPILTTRGDILVADVSGDLARLPVGQDDYVLTADSSAANGVSWKIQDPKAQLEVFTYMGVY